MNHKSQFLIFGGASIFVIIFSNIFLASVFLGKWGTPNILSLAMIFSFVDIAMITILIHKAARIASLFSKERSQFEAILKNLDDGVIEHDADMKIILMNPKAEDFLGVTYDEVKGLAISASLYKTRPNLEALTQILYPSLALFASPPKSAHNSHARNMEIHVSNPEKKFLVTTTDMGNSSRGITSFLKILHDISQEQLVSQLKSEFVSIAAHQLRTPLSGIKWTLKLLLEGDAGALTPEQSELLKKGYETNERMIRLVNDLLNASRIEEGKFGYEFKDIDVARVLQSLVSSYSVLAKTKGIALLFEKTLNAPAMLYADPEKLALAVGNVIDNALKYTKEGGRIKVLLSRNAEFAEIQISDTGIGIPEAEQKKVFSKFFRASNVARLDIDGTGLGLFIAFHVIKRHGGNIFFISKEGEGATFTIRLPLNKDSIPIEDRYEF